MRVKQLVLVLFCLYSLIYCDEIEQKLAKINNQGLPESVLYEAAGLNPDARSPLTKAQLAKALEDPQVQAAATKAALEYATKRADIKAEPSHARDSETSSYCDYSWVTWLPFMDCAISDPIESNEKISVKETGSNCYVAS
ncbi:hypothetical protein M8J76_005832 [Diaphorina citri]|jgi:hypothetical protein|nr:hypothetical protein M8J75_011946 [Diaphorina citri]KAI5749241.1 hypothetical protein M8J76_005832 [Diaphorina citri]